MSKVVPSVSTTSTGLLIGLGIRITLDKLLNVQPHSNPITHHNILLGTWQGILLFQTLVSTPYYLSAVAAGVALRFLVDLLVVRDIVHSIRSAVGIVIGLLLSGICSLLWNADKQDFFLDFRDTTSRSRTVLRRSRKRKRHTFQPARVKLDSISEEGSDLSSLAKEYYGQQKNSEAHAQITSLRSQAAAAAGDKRRFQEERRWAISQGNLARAGQLSWQIRKYEALRDSFDREARNKSMELKRDIEHLRLPHVPAKALRYTKEHEDLFNDTSVQVLTGEREEDPALRRPSSAPPALREQNSDADDNQTPFILPPMQNLHGAASRSVDDTADTIQQDEQYFADPRNQYRRFFTSTRNEVPTDNPVTHYGSGRGYGLLNLIQNTTQDIGVGRTRPSPQTLLSIDNTTSPVLLVTSYSYPNVASI